MPQNLLLFIMWCIDVMQGLNTYISQLKYI